MTDARRAAALDAECAMLAKYLTGATAAPDVCAAYRQAHEVSDVEHSPVSPSADRALMALAAAGPAAARIADTYAVVFARSSVLRRKLVLLVAILESRGESSRAFDTPDASSTATWILRVSGQAAAVVVRLVVSVILVAPLQLWFLIRGVRPPAHPVRSSR